MDPLAIKQQTVAFYRKAIDEINQDRAIQYRINHDQWASNVLALKTAGTWEQYKDLHMPSRPKPPLLEKLDVDYQRDDYIRITSGPDTVVPEMPIPELPKPSTQEVTEFPLAVPGWPGYWFAGNSTGPSGRRVTHNGALFELMIIGEGTPFFRKLWAPVVG